jgi:outer membrane lipoprotein-sorting protein
MTDLGDLLVLLHGARDRVSTVRAVVRTWRHVRLSHEAMARRADDGGFVAYAPAGEPERESVESLVRVWLSPPDRAREEREGSDGEWYGVCRGRLWWRYDVYSGAKSNEDQPEVGSGGIGDEFGRLLDPAALIGVLDFGEISAGRRASRPVLRVRAVPRAVAEGHDDAALWRLGAMGADELRLEIDGERGTLLRIEARFEQQPFAISEVLEIAFDEQFSDDTFVFTPPPGEEVRSIAEQFPVRRDLTIEQAVALAPFTVWIPARLPTGWETEIGFAAEQDRPPIAPHVFLHYRAADGTHGLRLAESPADGPRDEEAEGPGGPWRAIERNHRRMQIREPAESWQPAQARLDLDGTRILIHSADLGADALADLAAGLVRAPSEPPKLGA